MDMTLSAAPKCPKTFKIKMMISLPPDSGECLAGEWAPRILRECARAISDGDTAKTHHLLRLINDVASPYGDRHQRLCSYFLRAIFSRLAGSGRRTLQTLTLVNGRARAVDSSTELMLKFQEASPWAGFGHVAANGAILEAFEGETELHIIDMSANTLCTQWPTLLEALASRPGAMPNLRLTLLASRASLGKRVNVRACKQVSITIEPALDTVTRRMKRFARLMGVPFEFRVVNELDKEAFEIREEEVLAVNCMGALRRVTVKEREGVLGFIKSLNPKILTIVEEEADFTNGGFVELFEECLGFYKRYFDMLGESFGTTSNERLVLERECSRTLIRVLACIDEDDEDREDKFVECERRERGRQWSKRVGGSFSGFRLSDDVLGDVRALLKRYRGGWGVVVDHDEKNGAYLSWKDEPVVWASAWKP